MYDGDDPNGFLPCDGLVAYFNDYVGRFRLPVRCGIRVTAVENGAGYCPHTDEATLETANVPIPDTAP